MSNSDGFERKKNRKIFKKRTHTHTHTPFLPPSHIYVCVLSLVLCLACATLAEAIGVASNSSKASEMCSMSSSRHTVSSMHAAERASGAVS